MSSSHESGTLHQAHGHCHTCRYPVHEYPFGWQHVGSGMFACSSLIPVATCCDVHGGPGICTKCGCICTLCTVWEADPQGGPRYGGHRVGGAK